LYSVIKRAKINDRGFMLHLASDAILQIEVNVISNRGWSKTVGVSLELKITLLSPASTRKTYSSTSFK